MRSSSSSPASRTPSPSKSPSRRASSKAKASSKANPILESLIENYPECLTADGFDDALIGVVEGACRQPVACYDYAKCIEILMRDGMDVEQADEYMSFNVIGAYVGEMTPLFLHDWRREI